MTRVRKAGWRFRVPSWSQLRLGLTPLLVGLVACGSVPGATSQPQGDGTAGGSPGPLKAAGSRLVDANGREVRLTGVNWFGFETQSCAPDGLGSRSWQSMLDQMKTARFNTIRLPYSNQVLADESCAPKGIDYRKNPDLKGLKGLALMDRIVNGAASRGLRVVLDQHRPTSAGQSELWYTDKVPESRWIADWTMLARHYRDNPAVVGADLHNEPHGAATWGDNNSKTDWRLAAERAGNAILDVNPDWLIIVEGIETYRGDSYWWGGNLVGARQYPVRLSRPEKVVYSAHDYGPELYAQPWFKAADFPHNLPQVWHKHWAYLAAEQRAPVLLGEFGGRSVGNDAAGKWQRSLVGYLKTTGISYTYWSWNPNSSDTGGILQDNWQSLDQRKLRVLSAYQWPGVDRRGAKSAAQGAGAAYAQPYSRR
jgi:endoglucanase